MKKALTNVQLTRAYVNQLKEALAKAEKLALVLSSQLTSEQMQKIPEDYLKELSELINKVYSKGIRK